MPSEQTNQNRDGNEDTVDIWRMMQVGFLFVAMGGAIGAMGRYAISMIPVKSDFPILTLLTNIIGAVIIGFVVGIVEGRGDLSQNGVLFWKTGLCGGFTTFSTFSLEAYSLLEHKDYALCGVYVVLSVICCLAGVVCGRKLAVVL